MHVLFVTPSFPAPESPVAGIFYRDQSRALRRRGHRLGVLVVPGLRSKPTVLSARARSDLTLHVSVSEDDGTPVCRGMTTGWAPRWWPRLNAALVRRAAAAMYDRYRRAHGAPDVVHAHCALYAGACAAVLRRRHGLPYVLTEHSSAYARGLIRPWQAGLVRDGLAGAGALVALSDALARDMRPYAGDRPIEVLGEIVDTAFFTPPTEEPPASPFRLCTVALLGANKGIGVLLEAFAVAFHEPDATLTIAGDGPERRALESLAGNLGVRDRVVFAGRLDRGAVRALIRSCHVLVSASYVETFGITLIEAMACGRPVVATRSGGPESFVDARCGLLVPPGDPAAMAAALSAVRRGRNRFEPAVIRALVVDRFGQAVIAGRLEALYTTLVASR